MPVCLVEGPTVLIFLVEYSLHFPFSSAILIGGTGYLYYRSSHISCFMCCRSKFVAENALLRKPLITLRRQVIQPACTKTDRMILVLLAKAVRTWKQGLFIVREVDAYPLVLSENASSAILPLWNSCCTEVIIKKPQDACSLT